MTIHPTARVRAAARVLACIATLAGSAAAQGSDSCATPQAIAGVGSFPFDNTAATTVPPPHTGLCTSAEKNVWFRWQPPHGGIAVISTCNQTTVQTLVNVYQYQGAGCPTGGTVYCSFVGCGGGGQQGYVSFGCTPALFYVIEIGSDPGCPAGVGTFSIVVNSPGSMQSSCPGDGTAGACPCGNSGGAGRGCQNSAGTGGALLSGSGNPSLSADSVQFTASGELPSALTIFLQGDATVGALDFGDGLRCAGGSLKRLRVENAVAGTAVYPDGAETPVATRSSQLGDTIGVGDTRQYQTYYRDANPTFCPSPMGSTFNSSSGITIVWGN